MRGATKGGYMGVRVLLECEGVCEVGSTMLGHPSGAALPASLGTVSHPKHHQLPHTASLSTRQAMAIASFIVVTPRL